MGGQFHPEKTGHFDRNIQYENDAPYYYGLFNDVSKMQLALTTTKAYKFKVSAYKVGTGKWLKSVIDTAGINYFLPTKTPLKNKFIKGDILKDIDLASSAILNNQIKIYPEVDAFYATKSLTLDKGTTSIDFTLLRMGFGINFTVDAITSGAMEIYVGNDTLKLNSSKTSAYTVRQFSTALNSFGNIYSNATTFGDSIAVSAKWTSASGTTVTATGKYKFLRNYQKTINVQLNTTNNSFNFEGWANTITDIDGNVYRTVTIGTQTWIAENLKVTHYRNGDGIPNVTSNTTWAALTTDAYCDYNNLPSNSVVYGRLYNWYSVSDARNIAPVGCHVATDAEWNTLISYLGGNTIAGGKLKESGTTHWISGSTSTNSSGFTGLPSGTRMAQNATLVNGAFYNLGNSSYFWGIKSTDLSNAWYCDLSYNNTSMGTYSSTAKGCGLSVRCIKD